MGLQSDAIPGPGTRPGDVAALPASAIPERVIATPILFGSHNESRYQAIASGYLFGIAASTSSIQLLI